jgi:hypothetical protein
MEPYKNPPNWRLLLYYFLLIIALTKHSRMGSNKSRLYGSLLPVKTIIKLCEIDIVEGLVGTQYI